VVAGNCLDPPCSLFVLGGERNGSEDVLDRDAEEAGPGCQHPVVAGRSVIQEEILDLPPQLLDVQRSQVRIDQVELPGSAGQAAGTLRRRSSAGPVATGATTIGTGGCPIRRAGSLRLDGAGDGNEPALSAWEVSAVARR